MSEANLEEEMPVMHKAVKNIPVLIASDFPTVEVDKAMVGMDFQSLSATITLLQGHIIPKIDNEGKWGIDNVKWQVVGELKMAFPTMNALCLYYLGEMANGLNLFPIVQKHALEHPRNPLDAKMSYGPLDIVPIKPKQGEHNGESHQVS